MEYLKPEGDDVLMQDCHVALDQYDFIYDGTAKCPKALVDYEGTLLQEGVNYTVSYRNNVELGTGTIYLHPIPGKGCRGLKVMPFHILETQRRRTPFLDVEQEDWFEEAVKFVYDNNIMTGIYLDQFNPHDYMSRGHAVIILWRMDGAPKMEYRELYDDVAKNQWFTDAAIWAAENNIAGAAPSSKDGKLFRENEKVRRPDMEHMVRQFAIYKGYDPEDVAGMLTGENEMITRAEGASFVMKVLKKYDKKYQGAQE